MLKYLVVFTVLIWLFAHQQSFAQVENVIVERYYLSDSDDATDTTGGHILRTGSSTYRVFVDLAAGYRIKRIFGDQNHALILASTDTIFNNIDRPNAWFGYLINKAWFTSNPLIALDSWLTLGLATKAHQGTLKTLDNDSSFIGGSHNNGGSAGITHGLLVNDDSLAGIPITVADGLVPSNLTLTQWLDGGFKDIDGVDTTIFGSVKYGKSFISRDAFLQQSSGVEGPTSENMVLVAQLTTLGDISFQLNLVLLDSAGNQITVVAKDPMGSEKVSPFLTYPLPCGCRDPRYLEFNPLYGCDHPDSCKTLICLGCMDPLACNFNPLANYNVPEMCCYPGYCNDRNLDVVCPDLSKNLSSQQSDLVIFPNPANSQLTLNLPDIFQHAGLLVIRDVFGRVVWQSEFSEKMLGREVNIDVKGLAEGVYIISFHTDNQTISKKFIKN